MDGGVALGVGENGNEPGELELVEGFVEAWREAEVRKFNEDIGAFVDGVLFRVGEGVLDVVVGHVEIAAGAEREGDGGGGEGCAEFVEFGGVEGGVEDITAAGVGGTDDVGDAVGSGHSCHGDGGFKVWGTVIERGQEMVVEVDHGATRVPLRLMRRGIHPVEGSAHRTEDTVVSSL